MGFSDLLGDDIVWAGTNQKHILHMSTISLSINQCLTCVVDIHCTLHILDYSFLVLWKTHQTKWVRNTPCQSLNFAKERQER